MKVELIDWMGTDISVVNAARVSFAKESEYEIKAGNRKYDQGIMSEKDQKLIKYLATHNHWTPFGHTALSFRIKAPIFVARQLGKHQIGLVWNEVSRRYVDEDPEFYIPERWRLRAENVKQGSSEESRQFIDAKFKNIQSDNKNHRRNPCSAKFANMKARAKREGIEWSINENDVEWPLVCPILGVPLDYSLGRGGIYFDSPSIDKIDPEKGYIPGNVRIISSLANTMKSNASPEMLVNFARSILLQYKGEISRGPNIEDVVNQGLDTYKFLLNEGIAPEMARMVLPQNMMTEWIWTGNVASFARVCKLRLDPHTQKETRDIAEMISGLCQEKFPYSWSALIQ